MQTTDNSQDTLMIPFLGVFAILAAFYIKKVWKEVVTYEAKQVIDDDNSLPFIIFIHIYSQFFTID